MARMGQRMGRGLRVGSLLVLIALTTSGCFFGSSLEFFVLGDGDGSQLVSVSANSNWLPCSSTDDPTIYDCSFFFTDRDGESRISHFSLSGLDLLFTLLLFDPLILQVPVEASDFQGSYFHNDSGSGGDLVIITGQNSLRVDETRTLQAEPGMQLVVIDFPFGAPAQGPGGFNVNFKIPDDLTALNIKALFTGKVSMSGETFYVPLLPCTSDVTALPTIAVPLPDGGEVALPVNELQGCQDMVYTFPQAPKQFDTTMLLPMLAK